MDYDDSDFQSQSLHLAGEGSTDCPPVLQPYTLPKFDFDEGHLRFDSLVESEVFLGIESSEANNWIEDFSRGSSRIEFSSSAVESCSISRRNNVWSEATSSESVEMLLKSVGQEEIIPAQTIFEESDACKEVGFIKQMEPNMKNDDNILTETGDVRDLQPSTSLPDKIAENPSGLENVGDQPQLEDASQTREVELPVDGNSIVLVPNSIGDQDRLPVNKGSLSDEKGNDVNNMEIDNLVDYHPDNKMHENSSSSEMQVDNVMTSVQSTVTSSGELNIQDAPHHTVDVVEENPSGHVASIDIPCSNDFDKPHCPASERECIKEEIGNEDTVTDVHEAAKVMMQGDSILPTIGRCSDSECPGVLAETNKCEDMVVFKDTDVDCDQSTMTNTNDLRNNLGEISSSPDPILKGETDLHTVDSCTDRERPGVLSETKQCEDVISFKDTDTDRVSSNLNQSDSGYGTELQNSNAEVFSRNPSLKGDSSLHDVHVCSDKESPGVPADTNNSKHVVSLKDTDIGGDQSKFQAHNLSPMVFGSDTGHAGEPGNSISSCVTPILTTDNDIHIVDASSDKECSDVPAETTKCEDMVLVKGTDTAGDQSKMSPHVLSHVAYESDTVCPDEAGNSNSGISSSIDPSLKVDAGKNSEEDAMKSGGQPLESENLVQKSEAITVIEETDVCKGRSDENQEVYSSAEMRSELHVTGASTSLCDAVGVSAEELNVSPYNLGESTERCSDNEVYNEGISGKCDLDLSFSEKGTSKLLIESNVMEGALDGSVGKENGSSLILEDSTKKELIPTLKHGVDGSASVADVPLESCDPASCGTMDVIPLSSENCATKGIHNVSVVQAAPSSAMISHSDNKEETPIEISKDVSLSCTMSSPMVESGPGPVCEAEKGASCDSAGKLLCKTLDQSLPTSIGCDTENQIEPGVAGAFEISKRSTTELEVKRSDDAETHEGASENKSTTEDKSQKSSEIVKGDAFGNFKSPMLSACLPESSSKSADPDQPGCGSPKVFRTTEIPVTKHGICNIEESRNLIPADSGVVGDGSKRSNSSNPIADDVSKAQRYSTSDVTSFADLPIGFAANSSQPLPATSAPKIVEGPQTNCGSGQIDAKISQEASRGGDGEIASGGSKGTTERKRRRASTKGTGKESAKKGTAKATTPLRQAERGDKSSSVSLGSSGIFQFAQPNEIQYYGLVDSSSKAYPIITSSTSSLPDLNSSAPASLVFQQPFTDLQQVQLRAQIFVYGALIQGTAPDEAYMVSAYGGPDGGRSIWEKAWRMCVERLHSQKSLPINLETPLQSSSGSRVPDQAVKQSTIQGKGISSPAVRASTMGIPPPVSPMMPISSPLWSIPTPACEAPQYGVLPRGSVMDYQQVHTPPHPFQTSPIRNIVGQNSSWMSQSSFRGPWVASPQTSVAETNLRFSVFPSTESVLLTPVKEATSSQVSSIKHASSVVTGQTGGITSVFAGVSPLLDPKKVGEASTGQPSSQPKSRKRKKVLDSKELGQISLQPQSQPESAIALAVTSSVSTSVTVTTPSTYVSKAMQENFASISFEQLKKANLGLEHRATVSKDTLSKAKEARQQAEEASAHAAAAVGHSQEIWSQLDKQKHSRLTSDAEAKLASAAVAVAAAAAVAKAAAAAANVAANAAMQAVLMAEEAYGNQSESTMDLSTDGMNAVGLAAPGTVFRAEDGTNSSSSILIAAREAARRRVEAASSASKRAENMDAIVKAAELAAEAVSHAGTVVAMGDPWPLSELAKAGPEGYWKAPLVSSEIVKKSNAGMREQLNFSSLGSEDSDKEERVTEISNSALPIAGNDFGKTAEASQDSILEGSQVEVFKEGGGFAVGWFTATVLSLQDGKACVCYTELQSDEGSGKLQEWVALDSEEDKPPKIRVARLLTPSLEGTRKRRREAMADYAWSVGDKVDAWIQNSWWEGVVTEKNKKDETILKVHFPAQGETSHVKAWHLRPSLIWKDGKWVEWSSLQNDGSSMEDGLPQEKRIKLGSPAVEGKGKDKTLKNNGLDSGKPEEPRLLNLSASEKVFNIGKNTRIENKLDGVRTNRTGLQKEGSVKFGIPKPKRKFMEVSKHYVANQTKKVNESNDSVKFTKYLMPQTSGFRALKNTSKFDSKDKEGADNKLRGFRSEKQRNISDKTVPLKDNFSTDLVSAADGSSKLDHTRKTKESVRQAEGLSGKRNMSETGSSYSSDGRAQGPPMFSSRTPLSDFLSSKKVAATSAKSDRGNKGNFAPAVGKLGKIEENKATSSNPVMSTSEVVEPRRSNRRIQPTSRLLEGLQSSLSISKIPSVSHDKGPRSQNRNASRGGNHD